MDDDLKRFRVMVFFRLVVITPHAVWMFIWGTAALLAVFVNWFATIIVGRSPNALHSFISSFVRYVTHVTAYFFLLADDYPGFSGRPGFPIDLEIDPPAQQSRWKTLLRIFLAVPAVMLTTTLEGGYGGGSGQSNNPVGVLQTVGFFGWFAALVKGEMPRGMRNLGAYSVGYAAQSWSYLFLLTDRYPNSDPAAMGSVEPLPVHPITVTVNDDLRRFRLTVFFRFLLTIPHYVWIFLWGIAVLFAIIANWFAVLITGQAPGALHRFLAAYILYTTHVYAYLFLIANPFPGFVGESYDLDIGVASPKRQNRWITGFRIFLGIPALLISSALFSTLVIASILAWFVALAVGRMPLGLRNLGAYILRYSAQVNCYYYVLTDAYPFSGPPALTEAAGDDGELSSSNASSELTA